MSVYEKENIAGLAIISLTLSLVVTIIVNAAIMVENNSEHPEDMIGMSADKSWLETQRASSILQNTEQMKLDNLTCTDGTTNCTESFISPTSLSNTGYDPLLSHIDIMKIVKQFAKILAMTPIAPIYIGWTLGNMVSTTPQLFWLIMLGGILWQTLQIWLIIQIFVKK